MPTFNQLVRKGEEIQGSCTPEVNEHTAQAAG